MSASARSWWAIIALTVRAALARHLRVAPLALLALLSAVSPAAALSAEERALVGRVERYLGDLQALAAPFIQVSSAGKMARGRLYLWRPGRLRFEYDPPTPIVIISDGRWVSYRDNELDETTIVPLSRTPLGILVDDPVSLTTRAEVIDVRQEAGVVRLTLRLRDDSDGGEVKMAFTKNPFELKQWTIIDGQGSEVRITLLEVRRGSGFEKDLFFVEHPLDTGPTDN